MRRKISWTFAASLGLGALLASFSACMKVPGEVRTQFAERSALEDSNFNRRSGAPLPHTFLTAADLAVAPAKAHAGDAGAAEARGDSYGVPTAEELEAEHQRNLEALGVSAPSPGASAAPQPVPMKNAEGENR
jgi:hypothetical protein